MEKYVAKKIITPKFIPNNLEIIREIKQLTKEELGNKIEVGKIYIQEVEKWAKTFSGKKTIETIVKLNISFDVLYDINTVATLPCIDWFIINKQAFLLIQTDDKSMSLSPEEETFVKQKIKTEGIETNEKLRNLNDMSVLECGTAEELQEIIKKNHINTVLEEDVHYKVVNVIYELIKEVELEREFTIKFSEMRNPDLIKKMYDKPFRETVNRVRFSYGNSDDFVVETEKYFEFKEPLTVATKVQDRGQITYNYEDMIKISKDHPSVRLNSSDSISLLLKGEELNHLDYLEEFLSIPADDMAMMLGVSSENYSNMKKGNQKITTFTLWKIRSFFKVPIEYIINIQEYYKLYQYE